jgi:Domain of unknown function (DUF4129)
MIGLPPQAVAGPWTARQIHDTVAAIARQAAYATPIRQSILGRIFESVLRWIRDMLDQLDALPGARYLLIAAVALIVIIIAGRIVIGQQMEARRLAGAGLRAIDGERRDYWALAAQLDAAGNYVGACHAIYVGVLDALARTGVVKFHASKTSGDYARDLRQRRSAVAGEFASFARQFDRSVYSWSAPTHDDYLRLAQAAEAIVPRRAAA